MTDDTLEQIEALELQLRGDPDSQNLRRQLLYAYVGARATDDPRWIAHVVEFVRRFPRTVWARCPFTHVDPEGSKEGFALVEQEWLRHRREHPTDPQIARGLALFVADKDRERAAEILREALQVHPGDAELCVDAARVSSEPRARLRLFQRARELGSKQPNLLVWIARAAVAATEDEDAEHAGQELLSLVAELHSRYGERLDWTERGKALRERALDACKDRDEASALVEAINEHDYWSYWGHTTLGMVMARRGDSSAASEHLRRSAVVGDYRLRSYGPSFLLASELARHGQWAAVEDYLHGIRALWDAEEIDGWLAQVQQRKLPDFPDADG